MTKPHCCLRGAEAFNVKIGQPADQPWAMRHFSRFDPSGVL